jgi:hypothetical protein
MQQEVHSINLRVEQCQLDIQECLKHDHPSSSDDEDDAPMAEDVWVYLVFCFVYFETFGYFVMDIL